MTYMLGSFKLLTCVRASLSFVLLAIIVAFSSHPAAAQTTRTLRVVNTSIERGQNGTVSVEMDCVGDENTFGFSITFDQTRLTFVSAALGGGVPNGTVLILNDLQKQNGRVGIAVSLPVGASINAGTRQLVVLTFTALSGGASSVPVGIGDIPIAREFVRADATAIPNSSIAFVTGTVTLYGVGTTVSAASFKPAGPVAPQSIAAIFGHNFATGIDVGGTIPLPTTLLGTTIKVKDSGSVERLSQLFFVSPDQCNYEIPAGTAIGPANVTVTSGNASISLGTVNIAAIAPGIFCANANGSGVAAAEIYRLRGNNLTIEQVAIYNGGAGAFVPNPIDLGPEGDVLVLVLYGTGIRGASATSAVAVNIGGTAVSTAYAGVAPGYVGLDQINTGVLPRSFAGRGLVNVNVTVDGVPANTVTIQFK
jgi:uncharacterized protein (TIGR03437 family)